MADAVSVPGTPPRSTAAGPAASIDASTSASSLKLKSSDRSVLVNGESPLRRSAMMASISASPSIVRALLNRSMLAASHGSLATRSSAITRASLARPSLR